MPFYDVIVHTKTTSVVTEITETRATVEANSRAEAEALAVSDAEMPGSSRQIRGAEDRDNWRTTSSENTLVRIQAANFLERSPEERFYGDHGQPLAPRGLAQGTCALWTAEADRIAETRVSGKDRKALPVALTALVAEYASGSTHCQRHPGEFLPRIVVLARQLGCCLLLGDEDFALLVHLGTRECIGLTGTISNGTPAPELPPGWAEGAPYLSNDHAYQAMLPLDD